MTKLIRAKYQDNLEMMQWMKNFFDHNCAESEYDAVERRAKGKGETCFVTEANMQNRRRDNRAKFRWLLRSKILPQHIYGFCDSFAAHHYMCPAIQHLPTLAFLQVPTATQSGCPQQTVARKLPLQGNWPADQHQVV